MHSAVPAFVMTVSEFELTSVNKERKVETHMQSTSDELPGTHSL
jgi:hypothetical protein